MSFALDTAPSRNGAARAEGFRFVGSQVVRTVTTSDGREVESPVPPAGPRGKSARDDYASGLLRTRHRPPEATGGEVAVVDLFAGCGGLSIGVDEACRAVGRRARTTMAVDVNEAALSVLAANLPVEGLHIGGVEELADGIDDEPLTGREQQLRANVDVELLVGGPPCQGNSDLNNHTRRADPKNELYLRMARFAVVTRPRAVLVENVPGVAHDRRRVVDRATALLREQGYFVSTGVVRASDLGASQARRRHLLLAHLDREVSVGAVTAECAAPALTVDWAIGDLGVDPDNDPFDTASRHSSTNQQRIRYLFDNDLHDLPDHQRPDCHRLKPHSYRAVYGRMHGDRPAPTITAGFGSTGQGRFVHPHEPRTLTPHEAARLQGFPDWFTFPGHLGRRSLQEMIGNAVPMRLAYAAALHLLR